MEEAELDVHVSGITCDGTVVRLEGGSDGICYSDVTLKVKALEGGKIDLPANKCHHP